MSVIFELAITYRLLLLIAKAFTGLSSFIDEKFENYSTTFAPNNIIQRRMPDTLTLSPMSYQNLWGGPTSNIKEGAFLC